MSNYFAHTDSDATQIVARLLKDLPQCQAILHIQHDYHCNFCYFIHNIHSKYVMHRVYFQHFVDDYITDALLSPDEDVVNFEELPF